MIIFENVEHHLHLWVTMRNQKPERNGQQFCEISASRGGPQSHTIHNKIRQNLNGVDSRKWLRTAFEFSKLQLHYQIGVCYGAVKWTIIVRENLWSIKPQKKFLQDGHLTSRSLDSISMNPSGSLNLSWRLQRTISWKPVFLLLQIPVEMPWPTIFWQNQPQQKLRDRF